MTNSKRNNKQEEQQNKKHDQLDQFRVDDSKESLTTNQGLKISEDKLEIEIEIDHMFDTIDAVLYDALYIVGGSDMSKAFKKETNKFLSSTFDHYKAIGATQNGMNFLEEAEITEQPGVVTEGDSFDEDFIEAIGKYRHWDREIEEYF